MADARGEVTELLAELKLGRKDALGRLMPLVYRELRRLLVDHARRRHAAKRGIPVTLNEGIFRQSPGADQTEGILAVGQ